MKKLFISLGLSLSIAGIAMAQSTSETVPPITTPKAAKSAATMVHVRQVDLLVQLLPLAIKKEQFGPILTGMEKARQKEKQILMLEDDELEKLDYDLAAAVSGGVDKGTYPSKDLQVRAAKIFRAMGIRRQVATNEMIDEVYNPISTTLDAGQLKVMENSMDPSTFDPNLKKDAMDSKAKIRFFIKQIFLDPLCYDIMLKLQKIAG